MSAGHSRDCPTSKTPSGRGRQRGRPSSGQNMRWTLNIHARGRENEEGEGGEGTGDVPGRNERVGSASTATADGDDGAGDGAGEGTPRCVDQRTGPNGSGEGGGDDAVRWTPTGSRVLPSGMEFLSPPRRRNGVGPSSGQSQGNVQNVTDDVVLVGTTRGWSQNMPVELDSDEGSGAIDLTGSQPEDEVLIVSSNVTRAVPVVRKRQRTDQTRPAATTTEALVLRMLEQQQAAAAAAAAAPPPEPSNNPTCGICFEAMGKNTDRHMAAGNCGHVYCKPCLVNSVKSRKKCPMCSAKMTLKQIRNIFFEM